MILLLLKAFPYLLSRKMLRSPSPPTSMLCVTPCSMQHPSYMICCMDFKIYWVAMAVYVSSRFPQSTERISSLLSCAHSLVCMFSYRPFKSSIQLTAHPTLHARSITTWSPCIASTATVSLRSFPWIVLYLTHSLPPPRAWNLSYWNDLSDMQSRTAYSKSQRKGL